MESDVGKAGGVVILDTRFQQRHAAWQRLSDRLGTILRMPTVLERAKHPVFDAILVRYPRGVRAVVTLGEHESWVIVVKRERERLEQQYEEGDLEEIDFLGVDTSPDMHVDVVAR